MTTSDPFQADIARLALAVAREYGFALAGGHALIAHGIINRPTEDIDLFTDETNGVQAAAELVVKALTGGGLDVEEIPETSVFELYGCIPDQITQIRARFADWPRA